MMREGIYNSNNYGMPIYVKNNAAWLSCVDDWELYFARRVGCWPVDTELSRIKEIIIDKDLFEW